MQHTLFLVFLDLRILLLKFNNMMQGKVISSWCVFIKLWLMLLVVEVPMSIKYHDIQV